VRILINLKPEKQLISYQRHVRICGIVPDWDFCPFSIHLQKFRSIFVWGLQYKETSVAGLIRFICIQKTPTGLRMNGTVQKGSRSSSGRFACYTPRVMPQRGVLIDRFHFWPIFATAVKSTITDKSRFKSHSAADASGLLRCRAFLVHRRGSEHVSSPLTSVVAAPPN